ncbi:MAG: CDP-alcohol phosphatidyltransferase family protein [Candidatus Heimdallarchaeota archaeon]|nr:CDP-alcohol phosphatidyltransferase family protein [Candidatus Heimdallarchaeota archaeon]MCK5142823.1 CDP-alcohol phosphatidyltransferase family protein [Candidatus Heimdallarchaeota archaeon]
MEWKDVTFLQKNWIKKTAWILANFLTFSSLILAIIGIVFTFINPTDFNFWFAKIIALCSIFDFADGKLARISDSKKLAVDIDTIVDSFAFGIFPAIYLGYTVASWNIVAGIFTGLVYLGAVWFRLYRFVKRDPLYTPYFNGLPSPFAGMVVACLVIFPDVEHWVIMLSTVIISGFMLSKIPFPSFKGVPTKFEMFWIISTTIFVVLFAVLPFNWMVYSAYGIAVLMIIYLIVGPGYAMKLDEKLELGPKVDTEEMKSKK